MLNELGLNEDISCRTTSLQYSDESNIKSIIMPTASETKVFFFDINQYLLENCCMGKCYYLLKHVRVFILVIYVTN